MNKSLRTYRLGTVIPFLLLHLAALGVFFVRFRWSLLGLMLALYAVRMFAITAGYHRYFSHRTYKLGRIWQFIMALLAETSGQKGVLWWAAHHRVHHRRADNDGDIHSPGRRGFWWAHVGWVLSNEYDDYDPRLIQDFGKYPELRWLDRHYCVPPAILGGAILALGGLDAFVWGFLVSTVLLFHGTLRLIRWRIFGVRGASPLPTTAATISCSPLLHWARAGTTIIISSCMPAARASGGGSWM